MYVLLPCQHRHLVARGQGMAEDVRMGIDLIWKVVEMMGENRGRIVVMLKNEY